MSDVAIVALGAVSALGEGIAAAHAGTLGARAQVAVTRDAELERAGLARPFVARAQIPAGVDERATWLLRRALRACADDLDRARPGWRDERVGLIVGTSSGGMRQAEHAFARHAAGEPLVDVEAPTYFGPFASAARDLGRELDPAMLVLGACASSVLSVGLGCRWLARGACDLVLAGGFDDVTVFVAAGFEVLRATTGSLPSRPFRVGRDGMSLGEGAAILALARGPARARAFVTGFGASSDAVHLTAPDREGRGLARAAAAAITEAGDPRIDLVSPHATATPFNDPVEARIIAGLGQPPPVVHPLKAQIGHTLGAAGALELLSCVDAIERGILPAAAGTGEIDPQASVRLLSEAAPGSPRVALKLAAAFGGANAALVVGVEPGAARGTRPAYVTRAFHVAREPAIEVLASATGIAQDRLDRADGLVRLAVAAVTELRGAFAVAGAGIVVGSALATVETNAIFAARIRDRGARAAEPRRFPYTSPNAVAGDCSIAFGLTGPSFTVGGGMHAALEALAAASLLVEAGDADRVVVVAVDDVGEVARALGGEHLRAGAVALLVQADPRDAVARMGAMSLRRGYPAPPTTRPGHLALLPLVTAPGPGTLECSSLPDAAARLVLEPV